LKGEEIPLLARILQMADIYDALTTARPYKPALTVEEALQILEDEVRRGWRDPELVSLFNQCVDKITSAKPTPEQHSFTTSIEAMRREVSKK
jgi:putative two-component system response regulator